MAMGEVICFQVEGWNTADSMVATILTAAYTFFEMERGIRSDISKGVYLRKARDGGYTPRFFIGHWFGILEPSEESMYIVEMFLNAVIAMKRKIESVLQHMATVAGSVR